MFIDIHAHAYRKPFFQLIGAGPGLATGQLKKGLAISVSMNVDKHFLHPVLKF